MLISPVRAAAATTGVGRVGSMPRRPTGRCCASLGTRKKTVAPAAANSSTRITTHAPRSERRFSVIRWLSIFIWTARVRPAPRRASVGRLQQRNVTPPFRKTTICNKMLPCFAARRRHDGKMVPPSMPVRQIIEGGRVPVKVFTDDLEALAQRLAEILRKYPRIAKMQRDHEKKWVRQMGSLGGGNHFIELCLDESERLWVMLHSGSRGIGNCIGQYFIAAAREAMMKTDIHLPDRDLGWFSEGSKLFDDYVEAVGWAQDYAFANRSEMLELILEALRRHFPAFEVSDEAINCHHNYVQREKHFGERVYVTRKGAIRARQGELGIIPGSMGARSYIVRGKGNPESFFSCAHGAGRRMSRNEAKRRFSRADLIAQTQGVECRKDKGVLDEIPGAYKDIDQVMADQTDLVDVVHTLKQIVCVKG